MGDFIVMFIFIVSGIAAKQMSFVGYLSYPSVSNLQLLHFFVNHGQFGMPKGWVNRQTQEYRPG